MFYFNINIFFLANKLSESYYITTEHTRSIVLKSGAQKEERAGVAGGKRGGKAFGEGWGEGGRGPGRGEGEERGITFLKNKYKCYKKINKSQKGMAWLELVEERSKLSFDEVLG